MGKGVGRTNCFAVQVCSWTSAARQMVRIQLAQCIATRDNRESRAAKPERHLHDWQMLHVSHRRIVLRRPDNLVPDRDLCGLLLKLGRSQVQTREFLKVFRPGRVRAFPCIALHYLGTFCVIELIIVRATDRHWIPAPSGRLEGHGTCPFAS